MHGRQIEETEETRKSGKRDGGIEESSGKNKTVGKRQRRKWKRAKFDLDIIGKKFGKYDQTFGIHTHEGPCTFCPIGGLAFGP